MSPEYGTPFLIVGLGNPGSRYNNTRHNIGFECINRLIQKWQAPKSSKKFHSEIHQLNEIPSIGAMKVLLLKPQTYMNRSGLAVREALNFFKIPPETGLLIISDDLDLPPGQLRIRKNGGPGGHKGLGSIIEETGTQQFPRIRIGIGRSEKIPSESYVLTKIPPSETEIFAEAIEQCSKAVEAILTGDIALAMNQFNQKRASEEGEP